MFDEIRDAYGPLMYEGDVEKILDVSEPTAYKIIDDADLAVTITKGGKIRIPRERFIEFLKEGGFDKNNNQTSKNEEEGIAAK